MKTILCAKCEWVRPRTYAICPRCGMAMGFGREHNFNSLKHQVMWYAKELRNGVNEDDLQKILDDWKLELLL